LATQGGGGGDKFTFRLTAQTEFHYGKSTFAVRLGPQPLFSKVDY
jgi:hypothetical protein